MSTTTSTTESHPATTENPAPFVSAGTVAHAGSIMSSGTVEMPGTVEKLSATAPIVPVVAAEPTHPDGFRFETGDYEAFVHWMKHWVKWHTSPIKQQLETPAGELVALQSRQTETAAQLASAKADNETAASRLSELQSAHDTLMSQLSAMEQRLSSAFKAAASTVSQPLPGPATPPAA